MLGVGSILNWFKSSIYTFVCFSLNRTYFSLFLFEPNKSLLNVSFSERVQSPPLVFFFFLNLIEPNQVFSFLFFLFERNLVTLVYWAELFIFHFLQLYLNLISDRHFFHSHFLFLSHIFYFLKLLICRIVRITTLV